MLPIELPVRFEQAETAHFGFCRTSSAGTADRAYAALAMRGRENGSICKDSDYRKPPDIRDFRHAASGDVA
jgi:hypothetical protein